MVCKRCHETYLDTLKLCGEYKRRCDLRGIPELGSDEFVSALAVGMNAKLIVEVTSSVSPCTIALATDARHPGGRLVCLVPEPILEDSKKAIRETGLEGIVEFITGDPLELLPHYKKIDFSLVDCKNEEYARLLKLLNVNPRRSVVAANILAAEAKGLGGHVKGMKDKVAVRSLNYHLGKGMQITLISKACLIESRDLCYPVPPIRAGVSRKIESSEWIFTADEESGEEHIYRVPK